jgi:hypothetical protein
VKSVLPGRAGEVAGVTEASCAGVYCRAKSGLGNGLDSQNKLRGMGRGSRGGAPRSERSVPQERKAL